MLRKEGRLFFHCTVRFSVRLRYRGVWLCGGWSTVVVDGVDVGEVTGSGVVERGSDRRPDWDADSAPTR